ncbi:hypothetical protein [Streptomyces tagetis]|uniref:Secreted protein n=1 Tax=Streptomyces tagetis TaxID=2820809 RepID=A0A941B2G9_9ACTN|nr:hypothetical protein [Streptomyces sp. RG38]MBQ0829151.1 hypothetical protein [Streptomyces sp. RG38]
MGEGGGTRRRPVRAGAVLAAAGLLAVALPYPAGAAGDCPGHRVRTLHFATGSVRVHQHGRYLCAVTVPHGRGTGRTVTVGVQARGGRPVVATRHTARRAGPVTVYAGRRWVRVWGAVDRGSAASGWFRR